MSSNAIFITMAVALTIGVVWGLYRALRPHDPRRDAAADATRNQGDRAQRHVDARRIADQAKAGDVKEAESTKARRR